MEPWELDWSTSRPEQPEFNELVRQEVFLAKFCAVAAKNIIIAANGSNRTPEHICRKVSAWINKLKEANVIPTPPLAESINESEEKEIETD